VYLMKVIIEFVNTVILRVPLVEQELLTLMEHMSSPLVYSGVRVARSLVFCVMFCRSLFIHFLLAIVLSALLRFTTSDYPFGIFKLFLFYEHDVRTKLEISGFIMKFDLLHYWSPQVSIICALFY
jgi:hypothetical protein